MADYSHLSPPSEEWLEFAKTWTPPPAPSATDTPQQIKARANTGRAQFFSAVLGRPEEGLDTSDFQVPTTGGAEVTVRFYKPHNSTVKKNDLLPLFITFHGGGYFLGNLETEDPLARQVALGTGFAVLNVDYRHTPEWTFPAPVEDAWAAFTWAQKSAETLGIDRSRIFVSGVSAGATLAISVAVRALKEKTVEPVNGLFLSTPATSHPEAFPKHLIKEGAHSFVTNANAPFINATQLNRLMGMYKAEPSNTDVSPLLLSEDDVKGLAPAFIYVAGMDPLRDEGLLFAEKLTSAGVKTTIHEYPGLPHSFMSLPTLPSAKLWLSKLKEEVKSVA